MLVDKDIERLIHLIDKTDDYLSKKEEYSFFLHKFREKILIKLGQLRDALLNGNDSFISLLQYLDCWNQIRIRFIPTYDKIRAIIPLSFLNHKIYNLISNSQLVLTSNALLKNYMDNKFHISDENKDFLIKHAQFSTNNTHLEYSGFGRFECGHDRVTLDIERAITYEGSLHSSYFSFVEFFTGKYHFLWHIHPVNISFSRGDKLFYDLTRIPDLLATNDGKLTLLTNDKEIIIGD